jgi:hypothetical protein
MATSMIVKGQGCVTLVHSVREAVEYIWKYHGEDALPGGQFRPVPANEQWDGEWAGWERMALYVPDRFGCSPAWKREMRVKGISLDGAAFGLYRGNGVA